MTHAIRRQKDPRVSCVDGVKGSLGVSVQVVWEAVSWGTAEATNRVWVG